MSEQGIGEQGMTAEKPGASDKVARDQQRGKGAKESKPQKPVPAWRQRLDAFTGAHRSLSIVITMLLVSLVLPMVILLPPFSGFLTQNTWVEQFNSAGVYVLLVIGLNIVVGLAGLLDLGYAAFFAIGAYSYGLVASQFSGLHIPFWPWIIVGAIIAALFGITLGAPTLRLRGDYLAIVTLGFGEIVPVFFTNSDKLTGGTNGISGIDRPSLPFQINVLDQCISCFSAAQPWGFYITMAVIVTVVLILAYRLQDSRLGRSWMAIREDELAAASSGINTVTTKLLAFAIGASTSGFAGVFYASRNVFVAPVQFQFQVSFTILAMIVLGGMGNIWGVSIGAFIIFVIQQVFLPQLTNFLHPLGIPVLSDIDFVQYQFLLYGIVLVLMMLFRPEGLFPSVRRRRELHTESAGGEEMAAPEEAMVEV
jgi:branched-chain amino acid transport system permease protein